LDSKRWVQQIIFQRHWIKFWGGFHTEGVCKNFNGVTHILHADVIPWRCSKGVEEKIYYSFHKRSDLKKECYSLSKFKPRSTSLSIYKLAFPIAERSPVLTFTLYHQTEINHNRHQTINIAYAFTDY